MGAGTENSLELRLYAMEFFKESLDIKRDDGQLGTIWKDEGKGEQREEREKEQQQKKEIQNKQFDKNDQVIESDFEGFGWIGFKSSRREDRS